MTAEAKGKVGTAIAAVLLVVGLVIGAGIFYGLEVTTGLGASTVTNTTTSVSTVIHTTTSVSTETMTVTSTTQSTLIYQSTVQGPDGQTKQIGSILTINHAGYVVVSGTSGNGNFYVIVTDSFAGYPLNSYQYSFGYGTTLYIPVLPGSVAVYVGAPCGVLGCTLQGGSWEATLSVTYYG